MNQIYRVNGCDMSSRIPNSFIRVFNQINEALPLVCLAYLHFWFIEHHRKIHVPVVLQYKRPALSMEIHTAIDKLAPPRER